MPRELSSSGRRTVLKVGELLRSGFSGRIEIECHEGGVRAVHFQTRWTPKDGDGSGDGKEKLDEADTLILSSGRT